MLKMRAFYVLTGRDVVMPLSTINDLMAKAPKTKPVDLIVRRGALRRFHALTEKTAHLPVKVTWDRRTEDRRTEPATTDKNRRKKERRQKPPFTWEVSDFVVAAPAEPKKRKRR
jgi:hypothetical protein